MLGENLILRRGPGMICNIINSLEASPGPMFSMHKCDVETSVSSAHTLTMVYTVKKETSCVRQLKWKENLKDLHIYVSELTDGIGANLKVHHVVLAITF